MPMPALCPPPLVHTERLVLRRPVTGDAQVIFERYAQDPETVRYMTWRPHNSIADTREFLGRVDESWSIGSDFSYVMCLAGEDAPFGMIGIHPAGFKANFGYVIARPFWGKSYTAEALTVLADWVLTQEGIWRAAAWCDVDNPASARVMEKAGMTFEGVLRRWSLHPNVASEPRDCLSYAKVR